MANPGEAIFGDVQIARPPVPSIMNVSVIIAGERHLFAFRVSR
jgi:hypothetical protein